MNSLNSACKEGAIQQLFVVSTRNGLLIRDAQFQHNNLCILNTPAGSYPVRNPVVPEDAFSALGEIWQLHASILHRIVQQGVSFVINKHHSDACSVGIDGCYANGVMELAYCSPLFQVKVVEATRLNRGREERNRKQQYIQRKSTTTHLRTNTQ